MYDFITPQHIISHAFTDGEYISAEAISKSDIVASVERWVVPVVGRELLEHLGEFDSSTLLVDYLIPAVAAAVRYDLQPRLNVSSSQNGLRVMVGERNAQPDSEAREAFMASLRQKLRSLLRSLTHHLEQNAENYPHYHAAGNVMTRVTTDGGFVQVF
jgi:hypothetical protein